MRSAASEGLSSREAQRRLLQYGPNLIQRQVRRSWIKGLLHQLAHPLALLLWLAAFLAWIAGVLAIALAIVLVILLNALFAFIQEQQAENAVEALAMYLPPLCQVRRDNLWQTLPAKEIVPGDVIQLAEGDRVSADGEIIEGSLEIDMSALTGESIPVLRMSQGKFVAQQPLLPFASLSLDEQGTVFSGSSVIQGECLVKIHNTGMRTQLGRIAALSERGSVQNSPLEEQIRKVAWLIAAVAIGLGIAFIPLAVFAAGLSLSDASVFAIGLLVGNVPEGLLPVITLALAVGVREMAQMGAIVKRLSAVETLGSTTTICTDKTGTLTQNKMSVHSLWTPEGQPYEQIAQSMVRCCSAYIQDGAGHGDPTELALLQAAKDLQVELSLEQREKDQQTRFSFSPMLKRMSTLDLVDGRLQLNSKGAPEVILPLCSTVNQRPITKGDLQKIQHTVDHYAHQGLRVLAFAQKTLDQQAGEYKREDAERDLCFLGLAALVDRPRPEATKAVHDCQEAGIRVIMVTGDHNLTAQAVAKDVGIIQAGQQATIIMGEEADQMNDQELEGVLKNHQPLIFSRSSPQTKLRVADLLKASGEVVAMTGDGANDAPALRSADIGVAMGISGTDVAREASTMVLTDDNFATVVRAIAAGRRVFDNVRKFVFYIFAHSTPEVVPILLFALSGGSVPLPLTVPLLLAFDVGTETLPALALGREEAEPGIMQRQPRPKKEGVVKGGMLIRAWLFVGMISAGLELIGFFYVLQAGGWQPGDQTGPGSPLHHLYQQATTMTFLGMVMCQVGTAFAARTETVSLKSIGFLSNRLLLGGIGFEIAFAAAIIYLPPLQELLGTASLGLEEWIFVLPFPFIVWGADETRRWIKRRLSRSIPDNVNI